jgi:MinD-like ATPase involved in chromosome partitioning or flagellar assembly
MRSLRAWLDASPLATVALGLMQEATGRPDPLEPLRPSRPASLPPGRRIAFWSLAAGAGTSTTAALVAHRSAGAGRAPVLFDLDRWAPSLALRAGVQAATIADALLRPGRERECLSRWSDVPFLPGAPGLHAMFEGERVTGLLARASGDAPIVIDLGTGADALDTAVLSTLERLCVVSGPRAGQLQAAFCSVPLLREAPCAVGLIVVGAADSDGERIASRLPWAHVATIPFDPYLAADEFGARAPTMTAIDRVIRWCA